MKESSNFFYPKPIVIEGVVKCGKISSDILLWSSKLPFWELFESMLDIQLLVFGAIENLKKIQATYNL